MGFPEAVCFTAHEFDVMFQVMKEATNFDAARLGAVGCDEADMRAMLDLLRLVDRSSNCEADVCFDFVAEDPPEFLEDGPPIQLCLPHRFASWWAPLAELILSASSERELYLRTGFQFDELHAVVARLPACPT